MSGIIFRGFFCLLTCFSLGLNSSVAQVFVKTDTSLSAEMLVKGEFLRGGIDVNNIRFKGYQGAKGTFTISPGIFPLTEGIILSTGFIRDFKGPNFSDNTTGKQGLPGDSLLSVIAAGKTYDANILEFDFVPGAENVAFDFVFASEEYPEFVNSDFNDVFAFIITDPETGKSFNIARLPKTSEVITVNNVNHLKNSDFYIDNPVPSVMHLLELINFGKGNKKSKKQQKIDAAYFQSQMKCKTDQCSYIQFDGYTKSITAKAKLVPGKKYRFKIAIADVNDYFYDSAVLLRAHSFKSYDNYGHIPGDTTGEVVKDPDLVLEKKVKVVEKPVEQARKSEKMKELLLFEFDSYELTKEARIKLSEISSMVKTNPAVSGVLVYAHTDSEGSTAYNIRLSEKRAQAVRKELVRAGVKEDIISIEFFGEDKPADDNNTEAGRQQNRRVEVVVQF
ncbi:MAG: choice-of-anchor L domain-containing protein [Cytophagaceae bacterium]